MKPPAAIPRAFFVTGTDTNVGKTVVSAILCKGLAAAYWKPIQSGTIEGSDNDWIKEITQLPENHFFPESYRLRQPLSPHLAAELDGVTIDTSEISLPVFSQQHLVVEGAGGVMVPLNRDKLVIDLIHQLKLPTIVVARSTLGTINHTLLTINQLRARAIPILGVVLNGPRTEHNATAIREYGNVDILAQLEPLDSLDHKTISTAFDRAFGEWYAQHCQFHRNSANANHVPDMAPVHANENRGATAAGAAR